MTRDGAVAGPANERAGFAGDSSTGAGKGTSLLGFRKVSHSASAGRCTSESRLNRSSRLLKNPMFVIARRAKPGVAIQPLIDFIDDLDCFASLAMTILAGFFQQPASAEREEGAYGRCAFPRKHEASCVPGSASSFAVPYTRRLVERLLDRRYHPKAWTGGGLRALFVMPEQAFRGVWL